MGFIPVENARKGSENETANIRLETTLVQSAEAKTGTNDKWSKASIVDSNSKW